VQDVLLFFRAIWRRSLSYMAGGIGVAVWAVGAALEPLPLSIRWTFLVGGAISLLFAAYIAWLEEHRERERLAERLRVKLRLCIDRPLSHDNYIYRVRVENTSDAPCTFGVHLVAAQPPIDQLPLPCPLRITYSPDGAQTTILPGKHYALVDVFRAVAVDGHDKIELQGAIHYQLIPKRRQEFTLVAHCDTGALDTRTFVADFASGDVKFWAYS
jgi:hypothetical protein